MDANAIPVHRLIDLDNLDVRSAAAVEEVYSKLRSGHTGAITVHAQEGIAQLIETTEKKRLTK